MQISRQGIGRVYPQAVDKHKERIFDELRKSRNTGSNIARSMTRRMKDNLPAVHPIETQRTALSSTRGLVQDYDTARTGKNRGMNQVIPAAEDRDAVGLLNIMRSGNVILD
jgi:hypothetical protein